MHVQSSFGGWVLWLDAPGELTESQHMLLVQDVQLQSHGVVLMLNSSKAKKSQNLEVIALLAQEHVLAQLN